MIDCRIDNLRKVSNRNDGINAHKMVKWNIPHKNENKLQQKAFQEPNGSNYRFPNGYNFKPSNLSDNYPLRSSASDSNILDECEHIYEEILGDGSSISTPYTSPVLGRANVFVQDGKQGGLNKNRVLKTTPRDGKRRLDSEQSMPSRKCQLPMKNLSKSSDSIYKSDSDAFSDRLMYLKQIKPHVIDKNQNLPQNKSPQKYTPKFARPSSPSASSVSTMYQPSNISNVSHEILTAYKVSPNKGRNYRNPGLNEQLKHLLSENKNDFNGSYQKKKGYPPRPIHPPPPLPKPNQYNRHHSVDNSLTQYKDRNKIYDDGFSHSMETLDNYGQFYDIGENFINEKKSNFDPPNMNIGRSLGSLLINNLNPPDSSQNQRMNKKPTFI